MKPDDPIQSLADVLEREQERVVRLWRKRLRAELHELDLPGKDLRQPLALPVSELARLLRDRGEDALHLWPEAVRAHGAVRYEQGFDADDLSREFKALQGSILRVYARDKGEVPVQIALLVAELCGEATAAVQASFTRVLRTEEVRFREAAVMESVLHHVDVGILLADTEGRLSYATPPVSKLLGLPLRTLVGVPLGAPLTALLQQLGARHPDGKPFKLSELPLKLALEQKRPVRGVWMVIDRNSDGKAVTVEMSANPIWEDGVGSEIAGVLQTFTDRTESHQRATELSGAYDELRRLQGRLLQRTRTQALGQLAGGAAHALNNFLNVIRLRTALLRKEYKPEHLDSLDRTVASVGDLVTRLQDFTVQRTEDDIAEVNVAHVAKEALELARPELQADDGKLKLEVKLDEASPGKVRVDASQLRELLVNLLLAARDRMHQGGTLSLAATERDGSVEIRVGDTGRKYSADDLDRLFDPLKGKSRAPQLSLLLAVARNQVQRWGGELVCDNCEGAEGTFCRVRLPLAVARAEEAETAEPKHAEPPRRRRMGRTEKVLVVDDDIDNARLVAELLSDEGYDVKVAFSGEAALGIWASQRFDAVLLDALMPDMSGWELAKVLRQQAPDLLLAMITGAEIRGQNRQNLALVDAVFRKPVDLAALDEFLDQQGRPGPGEEAAGEAPGEGAGEAPGEGAH